MHLLGNGIVITLDDESRVLQNGCVAYGAGRIVEVGETAVLKEKYPGVDFWDAKGRVIMPGLINTHSHIYSAMARGMFLKNSKVSHNFQEVLENLWWEIDKELVLEDVKYSAYHTYMESIRYGVTTLFDHHASFGKGAILNSLGVISEVAAELGIRSSLCFEVSDRNGKTSADESIEENIRCIKAIQEGNNPLLDAMFGLHASFTINDDTLRRCSEAGNELGSGFHVHVAEGQADMEQCVSQYQKRVVERLNDFDILGEKSIAVHCIHINEEEMDILKATDTPVVHNPESNMGNAVGCADIPRMMKKGILTGLGTDAYTQDMFESLKVANIIHKHVGKSPSAIGGEAQQMLLQNNAKITARHFDIPTGALKPGNAADLIVVDYIPNTPIDEVNYTGHITFGMNGGMVNSTIIAGKTVMKNREFCFVDEEKIYAESRAAAGKLWSRLENK